VVVSTRADLFCLSSLAAFQHLPDDSGSVLSELATQALDATLLVSGDLARQGQAGIEAQMSDRGEDLFLSLASEIEPTHDPALIASIADPSDRAYQRNLTDRILCLKCGSDFWRHSSGYRQRRLELGK
jgi:hypothetical protein